MGTKIYNGISGVLKIVCAVFVGLIMGSFDLYQIGMALKSMGTSDTIIIFNALFLILAMAGYLGIIFRSVLQIKSIFKPCNENKVVTLLVEVISLIFLIISRYEFLYGANYFYYEIIILMTYYMYWISIALIVLDAIILLISICKSKIKVYNEDNCNTLIRVIQKTVIPMFVVGFCVLIIGLISGNIAQIKLNESLRGGFDSFTMSDFDGNEYTEDILKGHKITMVNIWGTFCHPCIEEMPALEEISKMYDEKDFQLIGIPGDLYVYGGPNKVDEEQMALARDIIAKTGASYKMLIPSVEVQSGAIMEVQGYPTTIFFNEKGEQIEVIEGATSKEKWIEVIDSIMARE